LDKEFQVSPKPEIKTTSETEMIMSKISSLLISLKIGREAEEENV